MHDEAAVKTGYKGNASCGGGRHRVHISGFEKWHMGADGLISASQGHFDAAEYQRQSGEGV